MKVRVDREELLAAIEPKNTKPRVLTQRQRLMLMYIGHGYSNRQVALAMGISPFTVAATLRQVYAKLALDGRHGKRYKAVILAGVLLP